MPTPKQTRIAYKRIRYHFWQLQKALNHAHNINVIVYGNYNEGPCFKMEELKDRINVTTTNALRDAIHQECMNELKDVW